MTYIISYRIIIMVQTGNWMGGRTILIVRLQTTRDKHAFGLMHLAQAIQPVVLSESLIGAIVFVPRYTSLPVLVISCRA